MKRVISLTIASLFISTTAIASPTCVAEKTDNWIPADTMQQTIIDMGYKIKKFKETSSLCYEIYGWDKAGKKVEVYFHPITGELVKTKVKD